MVRTRMLDVGCNERTARVQLGAGRRVESEPCTKRSNETNRRDCTRPRTDCVSLDGGLQPAPLVSIILDFAVDETSERSFFQL